MAPRRDWTNELVAGRQPDSRSEVAEMVKQMDALGLKGHYNPKNLYPGSPFTPSEFLEAPEVRRRAQSGSKKVLADWNILRRIVEMHTDTLVKRWEKKTRKKQKDLLLKAWPNMSPEHRPDYEAFRQENTGRQWQGLSNFQEAYKWPYINQQDLSTKSLLIFITNRACNPPSAFARADIDATRLGSVGHFIPELAFLQDYTIFMDGDTVETYGKLVSWEENKEAVNLMFSQRQFTPGEGLRVLELQEKVYPFLIKCCELILHDLVEAGTLFDDTVPESLTLTKTGQAKSTELPQSLASISIEASYRLPAPLDLDRLRIILAGRLAAAEDHLWALREDPGYFAETVMDWSEHRNDRLPDTNGSPHPTGPHTTDFWTRVIRNVINDAYGGYETWFLLHRQVQRMAELKEKYKDEMSYEKQLPHDYLIAILKFKQFLEISCETPLNNLKNIQSSPPLRHWFHRQPQQPGTVNMMISPRNEQDPHFHKPWGLLLILWTEQQRELFGLANVIDAFEQIMQDHVEKRNLSPYILDLFSDLAILSRALREVEIYQPWAATFEEEEKKHAREIFKIGEEATYQVKYIEHMDYVMLGITALAMPYDKKFDYPVDKKRTQANVEKMISAEKALNHFWTSFDTQWKRLAKRSIDACMGDHPPKTSASKFERTPPWVEPVKETKKEEIKEGRPWVETKDEKPSTKTKSKKKTKGVAQIPEPEQLPEVPAGEQDDEQSTFKVDKASLKVFNTLFFTPGASGGLPGEIPWIDFLRAMASTGFAAQKLYGSIWQFTPTDLDVERSIQFHEPHPAVKITFPVARRMGRRLTRAYGWHGGMFELEEKGE